MVVEEPEWGGRAAAADFSTPGGTGLTALGVETEAMPGRTKTPESGMTRLIRVSKKRGEEAGERNRKKKIEIGKWKGGRQKI